MRTIAVVGAAVCYPPLATGVTYYAPESVAYLFVKNLEATYLRASDAVSDARAGELAAATAFAGSVAWANLYGGPQRGPYPVNSPFKGFPPTPAQVAAVTVSAGWGQYKYV